MGYNRRDNANKQEKTKQDIKVSITIEELKNIVAEAVKNETEKLIQEIQILKEALTNVTTQISKGKITQVSDEQFNRYELPQDMNINLNNSVESSSSTETIINVKSHTSDKKDKNLSSQKTRDDKKTRRPRSEKSTEIVGTNTEQNDTVLVAAKPRLWLYVGRCSPSTTEDQVNSYLSRKCPGYNFEVTKLNSKGKNTSFKIGADKTLEGDLYSASFWPTDILVKRYIFFRANNSFE